MSYRCWRCGEPLGAMILPVSRRESCAGCGAEIHVCRMCVHFDGRRRHGCREERAEPPREPDRANFCDYFAPAESAGAAIAPGDAESRAALAALFGADGADGGDGTAGEDPRQALEDLFRPED